MMKGKLILLTSAILTTLAIASEKPPVLVINKGIGGNNTRDALNRFTHDVLEIQPDYMIIYLGMNDSANSHALVNLEEYTANMQKMLSLAKAKGISCIMVTLNPIIESYVKKRHPSHPAQDISKFQQKYNLAIKKLAAENRVPIVDLRKLTYESAPTLEDKKSIIRNKANSDTLDGVHLTAEGYKKFAELFIPVFKDRIKPGDIVVCFGDSLTYGAHMNGAGTSYGETYPAWLSVILNRLAGVRDIPVPPAPPLASDPCDIANGSFEFFTDTVHPDFWVLWNIPQKQEGRLLLCKNAAEAEQGNNYLHISAPNSKTPACLVNQQSLKLSGKSEYRLSYNVKGNGEISPIFALYTKDGLKDTIPHKLKKQVISGNDWKKIDLKISVPREVKYIRIRFSVIGEIDLDNITFKPI